MSQKKPAAPAASPSTVTVYQAAIPANEDDIVEATLRVCMAMAPGFNAAVAAIVDERIRAERARETVYIPQAVGGMATRRHERDAAILRDWRAGERIELLERRYNLSARRLRQIFAAAGVM